MTQNLKKTLLEHYKQFNFLIKIEKIKYEWHISKNAIIEKNIIAI